MLTRHAGQLLAVQQILATHLDSLQTGQHIQLRQADAVEIVDQMRVTHLGQIQPAATTRTARGRTKFVTDLLQTLAHLILHITRGNHLYNLLRGERTLAHTGGVRLHDAVHSADLVGTHAQTGANATDGGRGGSDVGVGSEVDIQHGSVGALNEDLLARLQSSVDLIHGVADHGKQLGQHGLDLGELTFVVIVGEIVADAILEMMRGRGRYNFVDTHILLLETIPVLQRTHTNTVALHLGGIGWTDTALGGTDLEIATIQFVDSITDLVEVEHNVSTIGNVQST